jgi:hypothetical protein
MGVNLVCNLEMLQTSVQSATSAWSPIHSYTYVAGSSYDGVTSSSFEIVANNRDSSARTVQLRVGTTVLASISIPANSTYTRRSVSFTLDTSAAITQWNINMPATTSAGQVEVYVARIIIRQQNATKTRVHVPLFGHQFVDGGIPNNSTAIVGYSSASYINPAAYFRPYFRYFENNWLSVGSIYLRGVVINSGTAGIKLRTATGNDVSGSEVTTTATGTQNMQSFFPMSNLVDSEHYYVQVRNNGTNVTGICKLYLDIPVTLGDSGRCEVFTLAGAGINNTTTGYTTTFRRYKSTQCYSGYTYPNTYFVLSGSCADNTNVITLVKTDTNTDSDSVIGNYGWINFNSTTHAYKRIYIDYNNISCGTASYHMSTGAITTTNPKNISPSYICVVVNDFYAKSVGESRTAATPNPNISFKKLSLSDTKGFSDDFNDNSLNTNWVYDTPVGTITESGGTLNFNIPEGSDGGWGSGIRTSPLILSNLTNGDFEATIKISSHIAHDGTVAGLVLYQDNSNVAW